MYERSRFRTTVLKLRDLATKLATISRRVLGSDHKLTIQADKLLSISFFLPENKIFQAFYDTKIMKKYASSKAPSSSQGI